MLLYKASSARNLPVMTQAIAQGADINWGNPDDHLMTPLIKAVESVSMSRWPVYVKMARTNKTRSIKVQAAHDPHNAFIGS